MEKEFKVSDFYDVEKKNHILQELGQGAVRLYLEKTVSVLQELANDAPNDIKKSQRWDEIFGTILSATLDHEKLYDYFVNNYNGDIHDGGLADNVITLLEELKKRRDVFSG